MKFSTLNIERSNEVLSCWLNRPDKRNAINKEMLGELAELFNSVAGDRSVRVFVLRGSGSVFSAGADLSMMSDVSGRSEADLKMEAGLFFGCFDALYRLPVPTICYVQGGAHGGANGLVAACDFTLSEKAAKFSFREVRLGLVPATVAPFVVRRTGAVHARKMMLGAGIFEGSVAFEAGLIDKLCTAEESEKEIDELAGQILRNAPRAVSETKKLLLRLEDPPGPDEVKELCTVLIARTRLSAEARVGIEAFFKNSEPQWGKTGDGDQ